MTSELYREFVNPGPAYRGKPFWAWNGKLEKEELLRQVHVMKEMGFGGFFMHSRTGLETEYLGEEWFELINACADEGEALGLESWLYDEDRWPSGTAGGMVTAEPKYRMTMLRMCQANAAEFVWTKDIVAAFQANVQGLTLHDYEPLEQAADAASADERAQIVYFTVEEMAESPFYNGNTYVDTLNREAIEHFIQLTHEKYKEKSGGRFQRSIRGIFTDEPHRGRLMSSFGSSPGEASQDLIYTVPYTPELFSAFIEKFGYDLKARLPELFYQYKGEKVSPVKWHYVECVQQLFLDHCIRPMNMWCEANGLKLTGHGLHEDSLTAQAAMTGSIMRIYEHMGYPGVDVLTEHNLSYWVVKQLASAARQLGKKWLLSELYGCTGWQTSFESHKAVGDWQALFGVNLRCHHLSWYTMSGEAKRDYPASIFHQSAWWKAYRYVEDYFSRIGVVMSQGTPVCDTLVVHPIESVWSQIHPGWCDGLSAKAADVVQLEEQFMQLFHWLIEAQIDFDYGDEEMMGRLGRVEKDRDGRPVLKVGEAAYRQVLVGGLVTIRSATLALLKQFAQAGGQVIFAGEAPQYVDAVRSELAIRLTAAARCVPFERKNVVQACLRYDRRLVRVENRITGAPIRDLFVQIREDASNLYIMLLNTNREQEYKEVRVHIAADGEVQEWDCRSGERYVIGESNGGNIEMTTDFSASGERVWVVTTKKDVSVLSKLNLVEQRSFEWNEPFRYELDEPNVCVLDRASYRIDNGEWQPECEILQLDRKLRSHYGMELRAGNMVQPWYANNTEAEVKGKVRLRFPFYVERLSDEITLVMESPGHFNVQVNGRSIDTSKQAGTWMDICFHKIPLDPAVLVKGLNTVELETDFHAGIDLEAIYLIGDFGVRIEGTERMIKSLPETLTAGDLSDQGLPFYSGSVTYHLELDRSRVNLNPHSERIFLMLPQFSGACVKIRSDHTAPQIIAWQPYEADITEAVRQSSTVQLQVYLTRRNTFGPLHQKPLIAPFYGPGNFVTDGEGFSENYMLIKQGLLSPPVISVRR